MNVKLLLVTHEDIGLSMLKVAKHTLEQLPIPAQAINIPAQTEPQQIVDHLQQELDGIPREQEVLILTDIYGATPCNIARALSHGNELRVVTGLNLPMLIRVFNYSDLALDALVEKAITGSKEGIRTCDEDQCQRGFQ